MSDTTFERVRGVFLDADFEEEILLDTLLVQDLGLTASDVVELQIAIENEFGFTIPDHVAAAWTRVREIVEHVNARILAQTVAGQ